jgi:hypothetical protein
MRFCDRGYFGTQMFVISRIRQRPIGGIVAPIRSFPANGVHNGKSWPSTPRNAATEEVPGRRRRLGDRGGAGRYHTTARRAIGHPLDLLLKESEPDCR